MEHTKHLWRITLLLTLLFFAVVIVRHFLVPESFGVMGFYRYDALFEESNRDPVHGAPGACGECHDEIAGTKAAGHHADVRCELCHAPLTTHVKDDEVIATMTINRSYKLCGYCHQRLQARPADMVQIDFREHLELGSGEVIPHEACVECHDADSIHGS